MKKAIPQDNRALINFAPDSRSPGNSWVLAGDDLQRIGRFL
jgi:hypothetical protein